MGERVDTCMLKEYLEKNYGYNEPIFINEIRLDGLNDNALRQYFKRMLKSGDLARFDTGIYYLPKASRLLKKKLFRSHESHYAQIYPKYNRNLWILRRSHFCQSDWSDNPYAGNTGDCNVKRIDKGAYRYCRLPSRPAEAACHGYNIGKRRVAPVFGCRFPGRKIFRAF